jgi:lipopolysaccharide export system protein LptC
MTDIPAIGRIGPLYRTLRRRNRLIGVLRWLVPALGGAGFALAAGQMYLQSLGGDFSIGALTVTQDKVTVVTPRYEGIMDDGTAYRLDAQSATASITALDHLLLDSASLLLTRSDGTTLTLSAQNAQVDTSTQQVHIAGTAQVDDSTGMAGTLEGLFIDYLAQTIAASGPVHLVYPSGMVVDGVGMRYDPKTMVWTFTRSTLTLPDTPGRDKADAPAR